MLIQKHGANLEKNQRVYEVEFGDDSRYVVTNSPGNAALAVHGVRRVSDKEIVRAVFAAKTG